MGRFPAADQHRRELGVQVGQHHSGEVPAQRGKRRRGDSDARLYWTKLSNGVAGSEAEAVSTSAASEGNQFRYADGQYSFNLNTKLMSGEGTYQLRVDLGDGVSHTVVVSLKK